MVQQARGLLREGLGHRLAVVPGPGTLVCDLVPPLPCLAVEVCEGGEGASRKERIAYVADAPLHASLFVSSRRPTSPRGAVVVGAQLEQAGIEVHGIAVPLEHRRAKVVVKVVAGDPAKVREGPDVAAQEALQRLVEEELQEQHP